MYVLLLLFLFQTRNKNKSRHMDNSETRGRPKKTNSQLNPKAKNLFSENSAVLSSSCLMFVFELFWQTKSEKRIGCKDGGYTIFQKLNSKYCFETFQQDLIKWKCTDLLEVESMKKLLLQIPSLGPRFIVQEVILLIKVIKDMIDEKKSSKEIQNALLSESFLGNNFEHIRFSKEAIKKLKLDWIQKNHQNEQIQALHHKANKLWCLFIKIFVYTILNTFQNKANNLYYKLFFADVPSEQESVIGQLDLQGIVKAAEKIKQKQQSIVKLPSIRKEVFVITPPGNKEKAQIWETEEHDNDKIEEEDDECEEEQGKRRKSSKTVESKPEKYQLVKDEMVRRKQEENISEQY